MQGMQCSACGVGCGVYSVRCSVYTVWRRVCGAPGALVEARKLGPVRVQHQAVQLALQCGEAATPSLMGCLARPARIHCHAVQCGGVATAARKRAEIRVSFLYIPDIRVLIFGDKATDIRTKGLVIICAPSYGQA